MLNTTLSSGYKVISLSLEALPHHVTLTSRAVIAVAKETSKTERGCIIMKLTMIQVQTVMETGDSFLGEIVETGDILLNQGNSMATVTYAVSFKLVYKH